MKRIVALLLSSVLMAGMVACSSSKPAASADGSKKKLTEFNITYVMPTTQSQFWSVDIFTGIENACYDIEKKYGVKVNLKTTGPAEQKQADEYVKDLENAVARKPHAIITATFAPDSTVPVIKDAMDNGVYVNLVNCGVTGNEDAYGSFYSGEMKKIGENAANAFLDGLDKKGIKKEGVIGLHYSQPTPALLPRVTEFKKVIEEKAPGIKCLDILYNQNDVNKAQSNVEDQIATYGDKLLGFYGANNTSGDGIALAIKNAGNKAKNYVAIGVDSDELESEALKSGTLYAVVVQDPYTQAYKATINAYEHVTTGKTDPKYVDTPSYIITGSTMDDPKNKALLNPEILKKK